LGQCAGLGAGGFGGRRHALRGRDGARKVRLRLGEMRVANTAAARAVVGGRLAENERGQRFERADGEDRIIPRCRTGRSTDGLWLEATPAERILNGGNADRVPTTDPRWHTLDFLIPLWT
jgi:hypothetical protein